MELARNKNQNNLKDIVGGMEIGKKLPYLIKSVNESKSFTAFISVNNKNIKVKVYYHEIFLYIHPEQSQFQGDHLYFLIPWRAIRKFSVMNPEKQKGGMMMMKITTMLNKNYEFLIVNEDGNDSFQSIENQVKHRVYNAQRTDYFWTFKFGEEFNSVESQFQGHQLYDIFQDFKLHGLDILKKNKAVIFFFFNFLEKKYFKILDNSKFNICPSYPSQMLVFDMMPDEFYKDIANFRSRGRLPLLCAFYPNTHKKVGFVTFWRCSQPSTGLFKNRSFQDEYFFQIVGGPNKKLTYKQYAAAQGKIDSKVDVHIYDMRGIKAAFGNRFKGKGSENTGNYANTKLFYSHIPNIHTVRDSFFSFTSALATTETNGSSLIAKLGKSKWLKMQSLIIQCAVKIIVSLKKAYSVVIHCSDGWDRTSQMAGLVQLLTLKQYRTIEGFGKLFDKEFVRSGHNIGRRQGFEKDKEKSNEDSPIMVQFFDSVHQIWCQFPKEFEFNLEFLRHLAFHSYSACFGNFVMRNEMLREKADYKHTTLSFWSYALDNKKKFTNEFFKPERDILTPNSSERVMRVWKEMYYPDQIEIFHKIDIDDRSLENNLWEMIRKMKQENLILRQAFIENARKEQEEKKKKRDTKDTDAGV